MSDDPPDALELWAAPEPGKKERAKPIHREAWRQEKSIVWARSAILEPHIFLAYDRAMPRGDQSHLFQWRRGVREDTLDMELILTARSLRWEFKAKGNRVKDDDGQGLMIARLRDLGHVAGWGITIVDLCRFMARNGVKLAANAEYQAMHYDGMVDSRIAKEEARRESSAPPKAKRARTTGPRHTAGKRFMKRAAARGILL